MVMKDMIKKNKMWFVGIVLIILLAVTRPSFRTSYNINGIFLSMMPNGVVAIGLMFALLVGKINIAIGSVMSLAAVVFAMMIPKTGVFGAAAIALLCTAVIGFIHGYLIAYMRLNVWLVAMALMLSIKGVAVYLANSGSVQIQDALFSQISEAAIGPIPACFFIYVLLVIIVDFVLHRTQFGRNLFAVGGSEEVAAACGINAKRLTLVAMILSSMITGLGGILLTTRLYSANGNMGTSTVMTCLPMVILGGSTFTGGKGSAKGTVAGCLIIVLISTFMNLFNIYIHVQTMVQGFILLAILISDKYFANKRIKV